MIDLTEMITAAEGKSLEFKRDLSSLRPILKTLVAFANTAGGALVIGRDDDGEVRGVPDSAGEEERLASVIADGIAPAILPDIEVRRHRGRDLLVVQVARWPGPFHLKAEGPERGVYVRLGSTNRRADAETLERLRREARDRAFDLLPCIGTDVDDLDMDAVMRAFASVGREIDSAKLESLGVLIRYGKDRVPSNGGVLLFGRDEARRRHFPDAATQATDATHGAEVGTMSALSRHQVELLEFAREPRSLSELMEQFEWKDRTKFRNRFVRPLLDAGLLTMTVPDKPRSSRQRYVTLDRTDTAGG